MPRLYQWSKQQQRASAADAIAKSRLFAMEKLTANSTSIKHLAVAEAVMLATTRNSRIPLHKRFTQHPGSAPPACPRRWRHHEESSVPTLLRELRDGGVRRHHMTQAVQPMQQQQSSQEPLQAPSRRFRDKRLCRCKEAPRLGPPRLSPFAQDLASGGALQW